MHRASIPNLAPDTMLPLTLLLSLLPLASSSHPRYALPPASNPAPSIGILGVPELDAADCATLAHGALPGGGARAAQCFTTFYMHWVQSAGARAVFLPVDVDGPTLDALVDSVNGVLFTGGSLENLTWSTPYMVAAARVFDRVLARNRNGTFLPLHGTCQGMQVLSLLASRNQSVMSYNAFDSENLTIPLDISAYIRAHHCMKAPRPRAPPARALNAPPLPPPLPPSLPRPRAAWDGHHSSRLLGADSAPGDVVDTLGGANSTINLHHDGVTVGAFEENPALGAFFVLVSTNFDRAGRAFVSTLEAWDFPITATQWHPERNALEWRSGVQASAHGPAAVRAMQYVANFFVEDARRNAQAFTDLALLARFSVFSYPIVNAPDAPLSGYQWVVYSG